MDMTDVCMQHALPWDTLPSMVWRQDNSLSVREKEEEQAAFLCLLPSSCLPLPVPCLPSPPAFCMLITTFSLYIASFSPPVHPLQLPSTPTPALTPSLLSQFSFSLSSLPLSSLPDWRNRHTAFVVCVDLGSCFLRFGMSELFACVTCDRKFGQALWKTGVVCGVNCACTHHHAPCFYPAWTWTFILF